MQKCSCSNTDCERHGNCVACRDYHANKTNKSYCEREDVQK